MKKTSVYDLPTRFFHWSFAFLFAVAFVIATTIDDHSPLFSYHMMAGFTIVFILILRLIWGIFGTTYARFSSFKLNPRELYQYVRDLVITKTKRYLSHNPASSYAAILMFAFTIILAVTGVLMITGSEVHLYEEVHEVLANLFLLTVILHLLGIAIHQFKHKDSVWSSMFTGKKESVPGKQGITNMKPVAALLFIILTFSWIGYMGAQYNTNTQTLDLFGNELTLGEEEHESSSAYEESESEDHDDD